MNKYILIVVALVASVTAFAQEGYNKQSVDTALDSLPVMEYSRSYVKTLVKSGYLKMSKKQALQLRENDKYRRIQAAGMKRNYQMIKDSESAFYTRDVEGLLIASERMGFYALLYYVASGGDTSSFQLGLKRIRLVKKNGESIKDYITI